MDIGRQYIGKVLVSLGVATCDQNRGVCRQEKKGHVLVPVLM